MISALPLLETPDVRVTVFECSGSHRGWSPEEDTAEFTLMLVQEGSFRRLAEGVEMFADGLTAYLERAGSIQRIAHPCGGDVCTAIGLSEHAVESVAGLQNLRTDALFHIDTAAHLEHRLLINRQRVGAHDEELVERTLLLAGRVLSSLGSPTHSGPAVRASRRHLAERTREALREAPRLSVRELAASLDVSMYHLCRVFKEATGMTVAGYRSRIRASMVVDGIMSEDTSLSGLAAEIGFADQPHMNRTIRRHTGFTPGQLRAITSGPGTS